MVLLFLDSVVGILITAVLAAAAVYAEALTRWAGAIAFAFGAVIVVAGGYPFLALLVLFVFAAVAATRFRFSEKAARRLQEGTRGERGTSNVIAHIVVPTALVLAAAGAPSVLPASALAVLYTAALGFGASDTFASEFGVLAGRARSLLTGRPVPAGTNGGVSAIGELGALLGALAVSVAAVGLFFLFGTGSAPAPLLIAIGTASGFLGCQVDSLLGETLENRGLLTKGSTNLSAMAVTVGIAAACLLLVGAPL